MHDFLAMLKPAGNKNYLYTEVAQWDKVLNQVELRMFQDIRYIGINLAPRYPVLENSYLHFANPYKKIGIEIIFKNSPASVISRKVALLEAAGWKIFTTKSQDTYHILDEFFRFKRKLKDLEFEDLNYEERIRFFEKYYTENAQCLLYYLKHTFFKDPETII